MILGAGNHPSHRSTKSVPARKSTVDSLFKVILLGDSKVGKSSIVRRLVVSIPTEHVLG